MTSNGNLHALPRYLLFGTVAIAVILLVTVGVRFLLKNVDDSNERLQSLEQQIMARQRERLHTEVDASLDFIDYTLNQAESVLIKEAQMYVRQGYAIAHSIYENEKGRLSDSEIKKLIRESLRKVRFFNGRGYYFIIDKHGESVLQPMDTTMEGNPFSSEIRDDTGHYIMKGILKASSNALGEGVSRYRWYSPHDREKMRDKISYIKRFEPYDWVIGMGDYRYRIEDDLKQRALDRLRSVRFGVNGYIVVLSKDGYVLSHPGVNTTEGKHLSKALSREEHSVIAKIIDRSGEGGGYIEYDWYYPNGEGPYPKISLVKNVPVLNWIIVAGFYPQDIKSLLSDQKKLIQQDMEEDRLALYIFLSFAAVVTLLLSWFFSRWIGFRFAEYQTNIEHQNEQLVDKANQLQLASRVFDSASEGMIVTSADNEILAVNDAFTRITGFSREDALGRNPKFLSSGRHEQLFYREMWSEILENNSWAGEIWNRRENGELFPQWLTISVAHDENGEISNFIASFADITERKEIERQLRHLADYDSLTNLPNRTLLSHRIQQLISQEKRHPDMKLALLYLDLDHFKNINDTLGHSFGDKVLKEIAMRLHRLIRSEDILSRLSGDEFAIVLSDFEEPAQAANMCERIIETISMPLEQQGNLIITPSIGVSVFPDDGKDLEGLLRCADTAVHVAKKQGRNHYQFYTESMNKRASERLQVETDLRQAISQNQFQLYYQPQIDLTSGSMIGCEALVRWIHPERGIVPPDRFIPLAEETGLILPLGSWVLNEACSQTSAWRKVSGVDFKVSVNVSVRQFRPELVIEVEQVLKESDLPASALMLEITESLLMQDKEMAQKVLHDLKALGVSISMDDFGTGYSSLAYLKRFNLDELKIDKTFIMSLPDNEDDVAITSAIIGVANHLKQKTVAEGVETLEQAEFLAQAGCSIAQGYYFERPLPAVQFQEKYLQRDFE